MYALKTDLACICCNQEFGFITHKHRIIVSDSAEKLFKIFENKYEIVEVTDVDLTVETIDLEEYLESEGKS